MKSTKLITIMAVVAAMTACSSEGSTPVDNTKVAAQFKAGLGTRAYDQTWEGNESIGISGTESGSGTYCTNMEYATASTGASATFNPYNAANTIYFTDANTVSFTAYYPYQSSTGSVSVNTTDQSTQKTFDFLYTGTAVTASKSSPTANFKFSHVMSKIKITFTAGGGVSNLSGLTYNLSGALLKGTFDPTTGATAVTAGTAGTGTSNTVATDNTSTLILLPQSTISPILTVTLSPFTYTATLTNLTLASGNEYDYTVTLTGKGITVSGATINQWGNGGSTTVTAQ